MAPFHVRRPGRTTPVHPRQQPEDDIKEFLARNELRPDSVDHCVDYARSRLPPGIRLDPLQSQGYCSLTMLAATDPVASIVQFRPEAHRLDVALADDIRAIFGPIAPSTRSLGYLFIPSVNPDEEDSSSSSSSSDDEDEEDRRHHQSRRRRLRDRIFRRHRRRERQERREKHHGKDGDKQIILHVYSMSFLPGTPLPTHRIARLPPDVAAAHRAALVRSLAHHFSISWRNGRFPDAPRRPQSLVASSLRPRMEALSHSLPTRFRSSAMQVITRLPEIEALPWVMTHGDLVPVNVLVDPRRGSISGLIDWAEAEYLPFGVGLYGLEELLSHASSLPEEEPPKRWGYFPDVSALRELFWSELLGRVPELRERNTMETVRLAGQMGVLLWYGIAFDDGRVNRVVKEGRDDVEIAKLDLFLLSADGCMDSESFHRIEEEAELRFSRRREGPNSFMFAKTDDEENVQELNTENPIRYRL